MAMISQLASVFSSQGVVLPDIEQVAFPIGPEDRGQGPATAAADFPARFEQAAVRLELSARALKAAEEASRARGAAGRDGKAEDGGDAGAAAEAAGAETGGAEAAGPAVKGADGRPLTEAEREQVQELRRRDREVRAHEQAHLAAAGGQAVGGAHYEYQAAPDGRRYAVGGHVNIRLTQETGNPRATLQKALAVRAAATAPADPSGADLSVAAAASQLASQARGDLAREPAGAGDQGREAGRTGVRNPYAQSRPGTGRALDLFA